MNDYTVNEQVRVPGLNNIGVGNKFTDDHEPPGRVRQDGGALLDDHVAHDAGLVDEAGARTVVDDQLVPGAIATRTAIDTAAGIIDRYAPSKVRARLHLDAARIGQAFDGHGRNCQSTKVNDNHYRLMPPHQ